MADYQITHTRQDGADADRRIDGFLINGHYYPIEQVIQWMNVQGHRFWTSVRGVSAWVKARQHANGRWYLTTAADGFWPNNLLDLDPC